MAKQPMVPRGTPPVTEPPKPKPIIVVGPAPTQSSETEQTVADSKVIKAEQALRASELKATQLGIPVDSAIIPSTTKSTPPRIIVGGNVPAPTETKKPEPGGFGGFIKDIRDITWDPLGRVGKSAISWVLNQPVPQTNPMYYDPNKKVADALIMADTPRRFIISGLKEATDLVNGGDASWDEVWSQTVDPSFGFGTAFPDPTGWKWVDRAVGFAGDVALDPINWIAPGGGVVVDDAIRAGTVSAGKEAAQVLVDVAKVTSDDILEQVRNGGRGLIDDAALPKLPEGIDVGAAKSAVEDLIEKDAKYSAASKVLKDSIDESVSEGLAVGSAVREAYESAERAVIDASKEVAKIFGKRGGAVLRAADARTPLILKWIEAADGVAIAEAGGNAADIAAAKSALNVAEKDLVQANRAVAKLNIGRRGAHRQYRGYAREDLAEKARQLRMEAERILEYPNSYTDAEVAIASKTASLLNDAKITEIATRGYNALYGDAGKLLGVVNELRTIGGKRFSLFIPKTDAVAKSVGAAVVDARLALWNTGAGKFILDLITPMSRKGLISEDSILRIRTALRSGKYLEKPGMTAFEKAELSKLGKLGVELLAGNKKYALKLGGWRRKVNKVLRSLFNQGTDEDWKAVRSYLEGRAVTQSDYDYAQRILAEYEDAEFAGQLLYDNAPTSIRNIVDRIRTGGEQLPILTESQQTLADNVRKVLDSWYNEQNDLSMLYGGPRLPYQDDYFPRQQTAAALEWAERNPKAADMVSAGLGVNRSFLTDNFIERVLQPGSNWFGHTLRNSDLSIERLNYLAKHAINGFDSVSFDFFENDIKRAMVRYGDAVARNMAYGETLIEIAEKIWDANSGILKRAKPAVITGSATSGMVVPAEGSILTGLDMAADVLQATVREGFRTKNLSKWSMRQLREVTNELNRIGRLLQDTFNLSESGLIEPPPNLPYAYGFGVGLENGLDVPALVDDIERLTTRVEEITRNVQQGNLDPVMIPLTADEVMNTMREFTEVWDQVLDLPSTGRPDPSPFTLTGIPVGNPENIADLIMRIPAEWYKKIERYYIEGYTNLSKKSAMNLPDIAVADEIAAMFSRFEKLRDPLFTAGLNKFLGNFNSFFKSWSTLSPGFHLRNLFGNTWQMIAAGVNMLNAGEALRYFNGYWREVRLRGTIITPEEYVLALKIPAAQKKALIEAFNSIDSSSYIADLVSEGAIGASGKEVAPGLPAKILRRDEAILRGPREALGAPIRASRAAGGIVENTQRFIFTYDGLMKGLGSEGALARTNKYLFDYADLSTADKAIKQIIPFWTWTSRNFPLQIETLFTNPKLFVNYQYARDAVEEKTPSKYLPQYMKEGGAFILDKDIPLVGGMAFSPQFGFPGGGPQDIMSQTALLPVSIFNAIQTGDPAKVTQAFRAWVNSATPAIRIAYELASGEKAFTGQEIVNKRLPLTASEQYAAYVAGQVLPPLAAAGNVPGLGYAATQIPGPVGQAAKSPLAQILTGQKVTSPTSTEQEILQAGKDEAARLLSQYFGVPFRQITPEMEAAEIYRLKALVDELIRIEEIKRQKAEQTAPSGGSSVTIPVLPTTTIPGR